MLQILLDSIRWNADKPVGALKSFWASTEFEVVDFTVRHPNNTWTRYRCEPADASTVRDGLIPTWQPDDPENWIGVVYMPEGGYTPSIVGFLPWHGSFQEFIEYFKKEVNA